MGGSCPSAQLSASEGTLSGQPSAACEVVHHVALNDVGDDAVYGRSVEDWVASVVAVFVDFWTDLLWCLSWLVWVYVILVQF